MKSTVCSSNNNNNNNNNKTVEVQSSAPVSVTPKRRLFSIGIGTAAAGMGIDMGLNNNCLSPSPLIHSSLSSTAHPVVVPTTPTVRAKSFSGSETKGRSLGSRKSNSDFLIRMFAKFQTTCVKRIIRTKTFVHDPHPSALRALTLSRSSQHLHFQLTSWVLLPAYLPRRQTPSWPWSTCTN